MTQEQIRADFEREYSDFMGTPEAVIRNLRQGDFYVEQEGDRLNVAWELFKAAHARYAGESEPFGYVILNSHYGSEDFTRIAPEAARGATEQVIPVFAHPVGYAGSGEAVWSGWACQYPGKLPRLYGAREIAELNCDKDNGDQLIFLSTHPAPSVPEEVLMALRWYQDEAAAIAKHAQAGDTGVVALTAGLQVLALDGGSRAEKAISRLAAQDGERS